MLKTRSGRFVGRALAALAWIAAAAVGVGAAEIHVAVDGDDGRDGTAERPLASLAAAVERVVAGDIILMHGGHYENQRGIRLRQSGTEAAPIRVWAGAGEDRPVLDFIGEPREGIVIEGARWHLKNLTVMKAGHTGISIRGEGAHHITLEGVVARANGNTGINISRGAHHNLILNCDSFENFDPPKHGQDADGFGIKFSVGPGNRLVGCRAWNNSDDGYDTWHAGGAVRFENCYAWANGVNLWEDRDFEGNGNGFKLGQREGAHEVIRCAAWDQPRRGFDLNGNASGVTVLNCTAVRCQTNFGFTNFDDLPENNTLRNNLSFDGGVGVNPLMDDANNSWNIGGVTITEDDFESLDASSLEGPRGPGGELPTGPFLKLNPTSEAIDAGLDVGLTYRGPAPDLGAFESPPEETGAAEGAP
jgi:hypothetical protein